MSEMSRMLATGPQLDWVQAKVLRINGDYLTLLYDGGEVDNVSFLDQYTPALDDNVHVLTKSGMGMLVLGSCNGTAAGVGPLPTEHQVIVSADGYSTWHQTEAGSAWETGVLTHTSPQDYGIWSYDSGLLAAVGMDMLTLFEIEVTMTAGGPAEFFLHNQSGSVGDLVILSPGRYVTTWEPYGAITWVPLPIGWGEELIHQRALGIGVGGGLFTTDWSGGGGRLRFTGV